jgi:hypothetical protein
VYRQINQEYITNDNGFFLDVSLDTTYLIFRRKDKNVFSMYYYKDEMGTEFLNTRDTFKKMEYVFRFDDRGRVEELVNWRDFRDITMSRYSQMVRSKLLSSEDFDLYRESMKEEKMLRRMVAEDVNYLFALSADTFISDVEYLRMKPVRSPFTGEDFYIRGNLKLERPGGSQNTMMFLAVNKAGASEKPILLEQCKDFMRQRSEDPNVLTELKSVGLNSEQAYQYHLKNHLMLEVTLSDVYAINLQSRGNIRKYYLWSYLN